ncbi:HCL151Wp [Eremothecium sinecaudum]|uniref:Phospholipid-transporting ATPase n=1 Tax=Eremothecium sinecaudum TaxID=45286 RepID=A0A0X8HRB5_9SACH|nr:HCL151Wp [Eremothecium sinecaudum]AMD20000.1 HCL151Wp [Eremothecium sinecaudum]
MSFKSPLEASSIYNYHPGQPFASFNNTPNNTSSGSSNIRRDRRTGSLDSFELDFDDSLDAALDSLQIKRTISRDRNNITQGGEYFELESLDNMADRNTLRSGGPLDKDTQPLISQDSSEGSHTRRRRSIPHSPTSSWWHKLKSLTYRGSSSVSPLLGATATYSSTHPIELTDKNIEREIHPNTTPIYDRYKYPSNAISNAKYNVITFIPIILYEQFKFFFNLYFLLVSLSQAIPALRIGYLSSYIVPLAFVLTVTMSKEALDDISRRRRDRETNNELFEVLSRPHMVPSSELKVGDLVKLHKDSRIPADMILLQSSDPSGESFIKTDQLDGETDWKLRIAPSLTQTLSQDELLSKIKITASAPEKSIHKFVGKVAYKGSSNPLTVDNTMWANTVLASSGVFIACVVYTGADTRQAMNTSQATVKTGLLELEINSLSKILCLCVIILSVALVAFSGLDNKDWYVDIMRYLILFSTIIPVSLRVNLDLGKSVYARQIEKDQSIPNTIVRTSTIPEDLGRIEYLLSDKTGTLTQNDMQLKKLHLGTVSYTMETMDMVSDYISTMVKNPNSTSITGQLISSGARKEISQRVRDLVTALAICHNVIPSFDDNNLTYQAASPDEIAIVKFTESVGLSLFKRDRNFLTLFHEHSGVNLNYDILRVFPFSSETKRMGILVFDKSREEYWYFQKGADTVMSKIVQSNDWLEEEVSNMAREGLRTLVIGRKKLNRKVYEQFSREYKDASLSMINRDNSMAEVVKKHLEHDLELLGLTGVEDKLQRDVKSSIELLRNAGVKIWMLTGDKVETALCVCISAKLITRSQYVHKITKLSNREGALNHLEYLKVNRNACLLIDGDSLALFLTHYRKEFFDVVVHLSVVIACRCTPQQKADVALLIRECTGKRVCCIGDGGNDVSMIQCADIGVGIVGKEGKQASLAADYSITQFCHLTKLLLWHGRNSYKRSAKLAQFVIHRGLLISVCQAVYSISSKFEPIAIYQGWLMVGYATCYTMAPVFSLTLDRDIDESLTKTYPELYKELTEGKSLSYNTFFVWVALSLFQGIIIQGLSQIFVGLKQSEFHKLVAISFTALIINELIMVALEIYTWNKVMAITELATFAVYIISVPFLADYFDLRSMIQPTFYMQLAIILTISIFPVWAAKTIHRRLNPPSYAKVQQFSAV